MIDGNGAVPVTAWRRLEGEAAETAGALARLVRQRWGKNPGVREEENLEDDVRAVINEALARPHASGVQAPVLAQLREDDHYREDVMRNTMITASLVYPLSYLVYGSDFEDVLMLRHDRWLGIRGDREVEIHGGFASEEEAAITLNKILGLNGFTGDRGGVSEVSPAAEGNVGRVMRLSVARKPAISGQEGYRAAIRIPHMSRFTSLDDYVREGTFPVGAVKFLRSAIRGGCNILVAGGTSTGKTTLLRVMCGEAPHNSRFVVIEDGAELHLDMRRSDGTPFARYVTSFTTIPSVVAGGEQQLAFSDLVKLALRYAPTRVILGESRGAEMAEVCKALQTGHDGSMSTIHAESAERALQQAASYVGENPNFRGNPEGAMAAVCRAFHLVVHLDKLGGKRRMSGIVAVLDGLNQWSSVYETTPSGGWKRSQAGIENFPRMAARVREYLQDGEIPAI